MEESPSSRSESFNYILELYKTARTAKCELSAKTISKLYEKANSELLKVYGIYPESWDFDIYALWAVLQNDWNYFCMEEYIDLNGAQTRLLTLLTSLNRFPEMKPIVFQNLQMVRAKLSEDKCDLFRCDFEEFVRCLGQWKGLYKSSHKGIFPRYARSETTKILSTILLRSEEEVYRSEDHYSSDDISQILGLVKMYLEKEESFEVLDAIVAVFHILYSSMKEGSLKEEPRSNLLKSLMNIACINENEKPGFIAAKYMAMGLLFHFFSEFSSLYDSNKVQEVFKQCGREESFQMADHFSKFLLVRWEVQKKEIFVKGLRQIRTRHEIDQRMARINVLDLHKDLREKQVQNGQSLQSLVFHLYGSNSQTYHTPSMQGIIGSTIAGNGTGVTSLPEFEEKRFL